MTKTDIVERIEEALRHDTFWDTDAPPLLKDAVSEMKRLRLTAAEREAIKWCIEQWAGINRSTTLRNLLERVK